jgi:predicted MFS family arabinose efflux permease
LNWSSLCSFQGLQPSKEAHESILQEAVLTSLLETLWLRPYILPIHIRNLAASPTHVGLSLSGMGVSVVLTHIPAGLPANQYALVLLPFLVPVLPTLFMGFTGMYEWIMILLLPAVST